MANDFMGQILGRVLGGAAQQPGGGPAPAASGQQQPARGPLGDILGAALGGAAAPGAQGSPADAHGSFVAMLLPLAMEWMQRSGGVAAVLDRFRQQGYAPQANSWVSSGANQPIGANEVSQVVGADELSHLSQQLGVDGQQVASGLAEVLPRVIDHVTPNGQVPPNADGVLGQGRSMLEQALGALHAH